MITRLQVRLARTALGWGVRDLARKAGVSPTTVTRFENGADTRVETLRQIQYVLERAGIIFVPGDEAGGPGVRLRTPRPQQE
jgi:transcriptional regulator with XRE-family HTH domain